VTLRQSILETSMSSMMELIFGKIDLVLVTAIIGKHSATLILLFTLSDTLLSGNTFPLFSLLF